MLKKTVVLACLEAVFNTILEILCLLEINIHNFDQNSSKPTYLSPSLWEDLSIFSCYLDYIVGGMLLFIRICPDIAEKDVASG